MKRPTEWTEDELVEGLDAELRGLEAHNDVPPLKLAISPSDAINIASLLQLAGSHPRLTDPQRRGVDAFVEIVSAYFEGLDAPYCLEMLRRGERQNRGK